VDGVTLTPTLARRLNITRQRLAEPRPEPTLEGMLEVVQDLGCVQIDPIRAVERTQLLVLWSRLGNYDPGLLDQLLFKERKLFEYWAHAASIVLTEDYPIHQYQMLSASEPYEGDGVWRRRFHDWMAANGEFRQYVLDQLGERGPLAAEELEDRSVGSWVSDGWNNGRNVGQMLSFLWTRGKITVAERKGLRKKWGLLEQCLPEWANYEPWPVERVVEEAVQKALRALGVGTSRHINYHYTRWRYPNLEKTLTRLVEGGRIIPVTVADETVTWPGQWYLHADNLPLLERLQAGEWQPRTTLLSPFDNLICDRDRTELMWNFFFRIEIYVPKAQRQYGYYVLPILHGDRLIGRIDPQMDRKAGLLRVNAIYAEPDAPQDKATGQAVAATIQELATFLGAKAVVYPDEKIPPGWRSAFL
jgi:uncharacterized protein